MSDAVLKLYVSAKTLFVGEGERGASLVEYALLVSLIAVVAFLAIQALGTNASDKLQETADNIGG